MGNAVHDAIPPDVAEFIAEQPMFFVATSPLSRDGRINLSPKGADSFRALSPNLVCYLDITGSGNETSAHLTENGRITFMFCSFAKARHEHSSPRMRYRSPVLSKAFRRLCSRLARSMG